MKFSRLFTLGLATVALASCKTITSERLAFPNAPVSYQLVSDMVDEETIENTIKFRNLGQQIVSFDYTISDEPGIPHVDCLGPNSGLVENLYPGAEAKVKNPLDKNGEFVTLGRVTYGKRSTEELAKQYKPSTLLPASSSSGGATPLPVLEAVNAPGE